MFNLYFGGKKKKTQQQKPTHWNYVLLFVLISLFWFNSGPNHDLETVSWAFAEKWLKIQDPLNQQQYKGSTVN